MATKPVPPGGAKKSRPTEISGTHYVRVTQAELDTFQRIRLAFGRPVSQVVQSGIVEAAHRLGVFAGGIQPQKPYSRRAWPDVPHRDDDETGVSRVILTIDPATDDLLTRASKYVGVDPHQFLIGATLRYLSNLKSHDPDGRFKRLPLPPQFEP